MKPKPLVSLNHLTVPVPAKAALQARSKAQTAMSLASILLGTAISFGGLFGGLICFADVGGLPALRAGLDVELHFLALLQGLEAAHVDGRKVGEEVLVRAVHGDEAVALGVVEPLHRAGLREGGAGKKQQRECGCEFSGKHGSPPLSVW